MKKQVLLSLIITLTIFAFGQKSFVNNISVQNDYKVKPIKMHPNDKGSNNSEFVKANSREDVTIGVTVYDAQVINYGNMQQRIWAYEDGSVGATWTGMGTNNIPERGCGYNFFDGETWGESNPHIGSDDRMGPPCYAPWGENGEIVAQYKYVTGEGPMRFYRREVKGVGDWDEVELVNPDGVSLVWQSMITSGDNNEFIHMLAYTYDAEYMGQENALLYYRSSDGGETWDIEGEIIEGLGVDYFKTINALSYAWANPVGSTIAFTYGFDEFGGRVFKSEDNGDSWEIIDVFVSPFSGADPPTTTTIFPCGIGTAACALDSQGGVHVIFPRMRKIFADGEASWYPYTDGLIYWDETMDVLDTTIISSYTLDFLNEGGYLIGWLPETTVIPDGQPNYANALWGFPQISIDAQDNMFVATSTVSDYEFDNVFYRHIFVNSSFDGGLTWEGQVDLNDDVIYMFAECAFPAMAPVIDDKVHIVYQQDVLPGFHEWLDDHEQDENQMTAVSYDKDFFVGIGEQYTKPAVQLSEGYPNPAVNKVNFQLRLEKTSYVSITLTNIVGKVVFDQDAEKFQAGVNKISVDVNELNPGTYFCTINVDNVKTVRKIIVGR